MNKQPAAAHCLHRQEVGAGRGRAGREHRARPRPRDRAGLYLQSPTDSTPSRGSSSSRVSPPVQPLSGAPLSRPGPADPAPAERLGHRGLWPRRSTLPLPCPRRARTVLVLLPLTTVFRWLPVRRAKAERAALGARCPCRGAPASENHRRDCPARSG